MHYLSLVMRVKSKQDPNLLTLFMGVNTIVKNEHIRIGMHYLTLVMGVKSKQDPNLLMLFM